jgi:putative heme-binding domain-containing protein
MRRFFLTLVAGSAMGWVSLAALDGQEPGKAPAKPQDAKKQDKKKKDNPNTGTPDAKGKKNPILATDPAKMTVSPDFKVELLYSVPKDKEGSWVNLCHDPKGRLYVSDQYGPLYRVTPAAAGKPASETKVELVSADIGAAQGLCWAFDSLYVVVNANQNKSGLFRLSDKDKDDQLETVEKLRSFEGGGGEHGPHAVMIHPDGKRLTVVCGNQTKLTKFDTAKPAPIWGEDHLLPRMPDGRGFMKGVLGPGGAIYNVSPDGKQWELHAVGFRNQYDAAYNRDGDLFSYDADMEWDFNTPWYRPTRVCFVPGGAEFGWRNGAGKYPAYYADSLPGVDDIGPGSPTGIAFGYGAKFPAKFQNALFICDWSYGKMYAVHLTPNGASYTGTHEEFVAGTPLPLTDVIVNPIDGAMYFTIGGRRTQSALYRVTYTGSKPTAEYQAPANANPERDTRKFLESKQAVNDPAAIAAIWKELGSTDRFTRFAARVALEHQDVANWQSQAFVERDPRTAIQALLALARVSAPCPEHAKTDFNKDKPAGDAKLGARIIEALNAIDWANLPVETRLELVRTYQVALNRFRASTDAVKAATVAKLDPVFPTGNRFVDGELSQVLVYLDSPTVGAKTVKLLKGALTQEEQIEYARSLRMLKAGWTPELRKHYFEWFVKAESYRGGMSFGGFLNQVKNDAIANLSDSDKVALKTILETKPKSSPITGIDPARTVVKNWKMDDLTVKLESGLAGGRSYENGKKMFAVAACFGCHRFDGEGGATGPDLTVAAGRFSPRDLLESILDPSKEISDQYAAVEIETTDGKKLSGRIINLSGDGITLLTNMLDPSSTVTVNRGNIESQKLSKLSMMPTGLLDTLKEDDVLDLLAYVLSRADKTNKMFSPATK